MMIQWTSLCHISDLEKLEKVISEVEEILIDGQVEVDLKDILQKAFLEKLNRS